jgi:hypothetical protein
MAAHKGRRGGVRPGAGRPAKPRHEKQSRYVTLALTEAEYAALRQAATEGEAIATVARRLVLRSLARRRK